MSEELEQLEKIANFFKRMNSKVLLLGLLDKAKAQYDLLDFEQGRKNLLMAYKMDRHSSAVIRGLGCYKQFKQNYRGALYYFQKALKYSCNREIEYTMIGVVYYLQEKLDEAVEYFNKAIDLNDNHTEAYEGRNQAMLERHLKIVDLQEALKKYF